MKKTGKIVLGVLLIAIGFAFLGNSVGWWDLHLIRAWWTLLLIVPAIVSMTNDGIRTGNSILFLVGVAFFLEANHVFDFNVWYLAVALMLIVGGLSILTGGFGRKGYCVRPEGERKEGTEAFGGFSGAQEQRSDRTSIDCIFTSMHQAVVSDNYLGGHITTVFGKTDLDLRRATIQRDIDLTIETIFGSTNVLFPDNVHLEIAGTPILGGISAREGRATPPDAPKVRVNCTAVFSGVELL